MVSAKQQTTPMVTSSV